MRLKNLFTILIVFIITGCSSFEKNFYSSNFDAEIGVILPLSGDNQQLGERLKTIILAAKKNENKRKINFVFYDSISNDSIKNAIEDMAQRNIKIILGPIFTNTTSMVAKHAKEHGMQVFSLSNNPALAHDNVYIFGHMPGKEILRIINYFVSNDHNNFLTILPAGNKSYNSAQIINNMLKQHNLQLHSSEYYSDLDESIDKSVRNISEIVANLNEDFLNKNQPVIFVNDDPHYLAKLFDYFAKYNLFQQAKIVGSSLINIQSEIDNIRYFYTGSLNYQENNLAIFKEGYINQLDFLAYDLALILATALKDGYHPERFDNIIFNETGFVGVSGSFKFDKNVTTRNYDIIMRNNNNYQTIEYANNI